MAKHRTKDALPSSPENYGTNPGHHEAWALLVPATLVLGAAAFVLLAIPTAPPYLFQQEVQRKNYGFLQRTAGWAANQLSITTPTGTINLSDKIGLLQQRREFSRGKDTFGRFRGSHVNSVLRSLGPGNPWETFPDNSLIQGFDIDTQGIQQILTKLAEDVYRQPSDAVLKIENGRAVEFRNEEIGQSLDIPQTIRNIRTALFTDATSTPSMIVALQPSVRLADTNSLGIRERIAHGISDFHGSTKSRVTNIRVGAEKFNGLIVLPGQEFSFVKYLGEVTKDAGFLPELVIKTNGTVPELGGGLCQVSTTAFRAALYGGLPITERRNHSYAVKYYAPQGTDATIYPGAVDLKFLNDTGYSMLIHTYIEDTKLVFDYYGTSDNRSVKIDGPYQYDFGAGGAMKARLTRTVIKNGKEITDKFLSKYVSQDLFPRVYEFPKTAEPSPNPAAAPDGGNSSPPVQPPSSIQ